MSKIGFIVRCFTGVCIFAAAIAATAQETAKQTSEEESVNFTESYLSDSINIEAGKVVWNKQCRHCHGKSAYPGKAPKLKPHGYTPDFVFDRVTNGFRKMPAWKAVFSQEERMSVVAYVLSKKFSP